MISANCTWKLILVAQIPSQRFVHNSVDIETTAVDDIDLTAHTGVSDDDLDDDLEDEHEEDCEMEELPESECYTFSHRLNNIFHHIPP